MRTVAEFFDEVCGRELSGNVRQNLKNLLGALANQAVNQLSHADRKKFLGLALSCLSMSSTNKDHVAQVLKNLELRLSTEIASQAFASLAKSLPRQQTDRPKSARVRASSRQRALSESSPSPDWRSSNTQIDSVKDVVKARTDVLERAIKIGFTRLEGVRIATCVSELTRNILIYAKRGRLEIERLQSFRTGMKLEAIDQGPGIPNLKGVMSDDYQSSTGLGKGLKIVRDFADEFNVKSSGEGTTVTVVFWCKSS